MPCFDGCIEGHPEERRRRLLDAGCGTGFYLDRDGILFGASFGVDRRAGMLAKAAREMPGKPPVDGNSLIHGVLAPVHSTWSSAQGYVSHVPDVPAVVSELARATAPGGMLLLSNVDASHPYSVTRLPTGNGDIFVDTFKHDREAVRSALADAGLEVAMTTLIASDGGVGMGRSSFSAADSAVTAWAVMAISPLRSSN